MDTSEILCYNKIMKMNEPPGTRTQNRLIKSQLALKSGQNSLDKIIHDVIYSRKFVVGGKFNVDINSNEPHLNNKGGGHHEDQGGNN